MATRQVQALLLVATEKSPRFISLPAGADTSDFSTSQGINPLIEDGGTPASVMQLSGLRGPDGPVFRPPLYCFHRDNFLFDGSSVNGPIRTWQLQVLGRAGYEWAGNIALVKSEVRREPNSTRKIEMYVDFTEANLAGVKAFFANYRKDD